MESKVSHPIKVNYSLILMLFYSLAHCITFNLLCLAGSINKSDVLFGITPPPLGNGIIQVGHTFASLNLLEELALLIFLFGINLYL